MLGKQTYPHEVCEAAEWFVIAFRHGPPDQAHIAFKKLQDVMNAVYWPNQMTDRDGESHG